MRRPPLNSPSANLAGTDVPLAVVLFSGGLDSTVLAAHYRRTHRLLLISFDYGQRHATRELAAGMEVAAHLAAEHHTVTVTGLGPLLTGCSLTDHRETVPTMDPSGAALRSITIPNRNAFITDMAVSIAMARHAEVVALGIHHTREGYPMPDGRPDFFAAYQEMVRLASRGFHTPRVEVPFIGMQKEDIVSYGRRLDAPLDKTWTCYLDGLVHCGTCLACLTRKSAFAESATPDPTIYDSEAFDDSSDPHPA
ncbi:7-cyano-7-deazaguanine synthase [Nonomuraea sp. B19D2]|uniref:7-cyano-7-deazaguanine synthase n=1 Tax=Nonomuraea sp. B19D2 TaxID=3159561 RepID=UPI0032DB97D7